jgi:aryl-alcohol dehydrogenase-like predicted oxidoreductase
VRAIGFSEWNAQQIQAAVEISAANGLISFSSSQPQYSILWRKPEAEIFPMSQEHGISNLAFSPLAHGVLSGKYLPGQPPPPNSRAANEQMNIYMETAGRHYRSGYLLEAITKLKPIASDLGLTMSQMALAWVLRRKEVTSAIIGASRPEQIAENVVAADVVLPADVLEQIDQAVGDVVVWS